jgi:hypothetical protein
MNHSHYVIWGYHSNKLWNVNTIQENKSCFTSWTWEGTCVAVYRVYSVSTDNNTILHYHKPCFRECFRCMKISKDAHMNMFTDYSCEVTLNAGHDVSLGNMWDWKAICAKAGKLIWGGLISLWLYKENKLRDWKKCIYSTYSPLSSIHLWLRFSKFFKPSKKNSFVCAANRKSQKLISTSK